jgi:hypothetical protein
MPKYSLPSSLSINLGGIYMEIPIEKVIPQIVEYNERERAAADAERAAADAAESARQERIRVAKRARHLALNNAVTNHHDPKKLPERLREKKGYVTNPETFVVHAFASPSGNKHEYSGTWHRLGHAEDPTPTKYKWSGRLHVHTYNGRTHSGRQCISTYRPGSMDVDYFDPDDNKTVSVLYEIKDVEYDWRWPEESEEEGAILWKELYGYIVTYNYDSDDSRQIKINGGVRELKDGRSELYLHVV